MRTRRTMLNLAFSVVSLFASSVLSLLLTRVVLQHLGSDYNGLNGTISQFMAVLMLVESGFTIAALVKLYKPYGDEDYQAINEILSKANIEFRKIGFVMVGLGFAVSAIYASIIKTSVEYGIIIVLFFYSIATTAFNFAYTYKFRIMFQVAQREYVIYAVNILQHLIVYIGMILIIQYTKSIIYARSFYVLINICAGLAIGIIAKKLFPRARYNVDCSNIRIEGTKDLFMSKLVGILYTSLTPFYLAVFVGTLQTSVYVVYNSVISVISNLINTALTAPQNALGQIINSEKEKVKKTVIEYEYSALLISAILLTSTMALIIPFVRFYTTGVNDINYIQPSVAIILVLISASQLIHIPSGKCIELSGDFKAVKRIQLTTFFLLAVLSIVGASSAGLIGLLTAQLVTNVVLAWMEISYAHRKIINDTTGFLKMLYPHIGLALLLSVLECGLLYEVQINWISFVGIGLIVVIVNAVLFCLWGYVFFRAQMLPIFTRLTKIIKKLFATR